MKNRGRFWSVAISITVMKVVASRVYLLPDITHGIFGLRQDSKYI